MEKKTLLQFLLCIAILLTTAGQAYCQEFWKGRIITNGGNSPVIYSLVDGFIYKFNSESKLWLKKGNGPTGIPDYGELQLDDRGYIWSGTLEGSLIYTKDEGLTWTVFGKNPTGYSAFIKVIGDYVYTYGFAGGVAKTYRRKADGSADWQLIYSGDTPEDITVTVNGDIYLSIYLFKVFKSTDNGATWTNTGGPDFKFNSTPDKLQSVGNKVFIGTYWEGVYYSDDGGVSWKKSTGFPTGQDTFTGSRGVSKIVIKNETEIFALVKDQLATFGWYKSNDGGQTFQAMTFPYNRWVVNWLDEMGLSGNDIIVSADQRGFFHTNNNGTIWTEVNNGVNNVKPHHVSRLMKNSSGEIFALMSFGIQGAGPGDSWGLLKSGDNGATWVPIDDQLEDRYMTLEDLLVAKNGDLYVTTYDPGTYQKSKDNGVTWQMNKVTPLPSGGDPMQSFNASTVTMMREVGLDTILAGSYFNNIWRTYNGGTTWTQQVIKPGAGVTNFDTKGKTIYAISRDQVGYNGLFKSTDIGNTWSKINTNGSYFFDKIKIFGTSLFATAGSVVYRSDDDGVNWANISPVIQGNGYIVCLDIITTTPTSGRTQADEANLMVGTYAGLFSTPVSTTQWKKVGEGVVYSIVKAGNNVLIGTETGATVEAVAEAVKQSQSINFSPLPAKAIGDASFNILGTASSSLPVTFTSSNPSVATINGNSVTIVGAGATVIKATQVGNATYSAAAVTRSLVVTKKMQTITFNAIPVKDVNDLPFASGATSSAGLPISISSDNLLVATVVGNVITIKGIGTAKITASQGGNDTYGAADPVTRTLMVITKTSQTITFGALADKTVGDPIFGLTATSTSNLPVTFSTVSDRITIATSQVTLVKPGRVIVKANQAGNENYNAAPQVEQSFCIKAAKPTIATGAGGENLILSSSAPDGNQWYKDGTAIAGANGNTFVATAVGVYKVQAKVDDCISEFSNNVTLVVTGVLGPENTVITAYPNPVEDYVEVSGISEEISGAQLFDMTGRSSSLMLEKTGEVYRGNVQHLSSGLYVLRVREGNSVRQVRLVKR